MKKLTAAFFTAVLLLSPLTGFAEGTAAMDLSGTWRFQMDERDLGITEQWFSKTLEQTVTLPGSILEQGYGEKVSRDTKFARDRFWFDRELFDQGIDKLTKFAEPPAYYLGAAWFQRDVEIPEEMAGKAITLHLERVMWKSQVWLDGQEVGECKSLYTPHDYDLGTLVPGKHTITVMIDNRQQASIGALGHGYTDHTQSIWLGVIGDLKLVAKNQINIADLQVYGNANQKTAKVVVKISNASKRSGKGVLIAVAQQKRDKTKETIPVTWTAEGGVAEFELALDADAKLWDEFAPNLFTLDVALKTRRGIIDVKRTTFGLRDFGVEGRRFTINERVINLRGTLECAIFPLTGYPAMDVAEWRRIFKTCKNYGLNHIRFHSWFPPEAAFVAGDELGMYLLPEFVWTALVDRPPQEWVENEARRALRIYGNHPSFCMMAVGNESYAEINWLTGILKEWKALDSRHLYTGQANGWLRNTENVQLRIDPPVTPEHDFTIAQALVGKPIRAKKHLGAGLTNCRFSNKKPCTTVDYHEEIMACEIPVIAHEASQRCAYPDLEKQIEKYKKGTFRITNLETALERMKESGMLELNEAFVRASGKLQTQLNKEEVEGFLRTKDYAGFQLLDLHDFPGQGTALVGVLDAFWDSKGYVTPEEFRKFCSPTVPLLRIPKRVFTTGEKLRGTVEIAHYGRAPFKHATPYWNVFDQDGQCLLSGRLPARNIPLGNGIQLGEINIDTRKLNGLGKYRIAIGLKETGVENDWEFWVYPAAVATTAPDNVTVVDSLSSDAAKEALKKGGRVLLLANPSAVKETVVSGFATPFWVPELPPRTLGILCDPAHPAFAEFPTDEYTNWQWWELLSKIHAPNLNSLPEELSPIVRVIDDWNYNRRLGVLFEANVNGGRLMVCSLDLATDLDERIVARQLRHSLLKYMSSEAFNPTLEIDPAALEELFPWIAPQSLFQARDVLVKVDSESKPLHIAANAVDGNPKTIWHTPWRKGKVTPFPHEIIVDLKETREVKGISYLPRQDSANGRIGKYSIYLSKNGFDWGKPVASGRWPTDSDKLETCTFAAEEANYLRLVAESGHNDNPSASVAEIDVIYEE